MQCRQESSLYSPFEVMFGRKPTLPIELDGKHIPPQRSDTTDVDDATRMLTDNRLSILREVKENIKRAQLKQKKLYDKKHHTSKSFQVHCTCIIK